MARRESTQIAIIGAGAMGAWTAFHMARRGARVTVIERSFPGAQASGVNYGNMRIQGRFLPQLPLSLRAQNIWQQTEELVGVDVEFRQSGHMLLAMTAEHMAKNEAYAREAATYDYHLELLDAAEVRRRWPWIAPKAVGASFSPIDGAVNPRLVTPAVAAAITRFGVTIVEGEKVVAAERCGSGFRITTEPGRIIDAELLLNCAGAWAPEVASWFGETVPLFVAGPTEMVTEPLPYFMVPTLQTVDASIVIRQVERGNIIVAGHPRGPADAVKMRSRMAGAKTLVNLQKVADMVPSLAGVSVIRTWSGIEGYLPDLIPVMGASGTTPGLFHAFGFSGGGMQLSPAVGAVMSELMLDGRSETPVEPFGIGRFQDGARPRAAHVDNAEEFDAGVVKV
ncbi:MULTISPECIES: NAD(P)/FAD-dependent oxidoreductase [Chelativorans]|uniref:FAD dependent oxidoreductase n=1 Tax=Chelativorans sp. (strain BNC1) TaxID=266779 RepID=Q11C70_CHESB|nr:MULTISPECIES: FAD-binding oxidoreductase [Chelativorans]